MKNIFFFYLGVLLLFFVGCQFTSKDTDQNVLSEFVTVSDSIAPDGTQKMIGDSIICFYKTMSDNELPLIDPVVYYNDKMYKAQIVVFVPKNITAISNLNTLEFSRFGQFRGVYVEKGNPSFCSVDGVLFNADKSELLFYPVGKDADEYVVPNEVQTIGCSAFNNSKLAKVILPDSLKVIDTMAFSNCFNLKSLDLPAAVEEIRESAFNMVVEVPSEAPRLDSVCVIAQNINIPVDSKLKRIEVSALPFAKRVFIPASVENLTTQAFGKPYYEVDEAHPYFTSIDGVLFNKDTTVLVSCPSDKEGVYEIPSSVLVIDSSAFLFCKGLTGVVMNEGLKKICKSAFSGCISLSEISIPASVDTIEIGAFSVNDVHNSGALKRFIVDADNKNYQSSNDVLFSKGMKVLLAYPQGRINAVYRIPASVDSISDYGFCFAVNLYEVVLPERLKYVGKSAFGECNRLTKIVFPASVSEIGSSCFYSTDNSKIDNPTKVYFRSEIPPKYGQLNANVDVYVPTKALSNFKKNPDFESLHEITAY